ncbi:hypothetical protein apy_16470 [Aeropyrum pernix]|uniref:DUF981 domain-containing protein n=1 Tax=Aeropyrum pernix TaxID=56636 RepID=A0A401HC30_AERPX|nr:DUF981 family protein [Aeropyrum pernix]GBF09922.1 hypothetical protein apy_16470 [Aeropyrum pernix]
MALLFVDPLDLWLMLLGTTLLVTAYWVYQNFISQKGAEEISRINRTLGFFYLPLGVYALLSGLWATAVWPLPGPYNIVLMDPWAIFGVALIFFGLANIYGYKPVPLFYGVAALSVPVVVYGLVIWAKELTREPILAGLMYFALGLAGLISPLLGYYGERTKIIAWAAIALLIISGLISLWIGIEAAFSHVDRWSDWIPWYGTVSTG